MQCAGSEIDQAMAPPLMTFEEVRSVLKQRFPMIMVDRVTALEPGLCIRTTKNVTGNEIQFLGHFPEWAVMPGTLIIEAMGQSASILFSKTTGAGSGPGEFLMLGSIDKMRFLAPVRPGDRLELDMRVLKFIDDRALVEGVATVDHTVVARGTLGFARKCLEGAWQASHAVRKESQAEPSLLTEGVES
jgi:3-hydroxyacyl-[acyl-carrier-protein] dehydratase